VATRRPTIAEAVTTDFESREIERRTAPLPEAPERLTDRTLTLRISNDDFASLKKIYASHGLSVSAGVRMLIKDFLAKQK
jgi:predicted DNA binding CopG/RHH family protein